MRASNDVTEEGKERKKTKIDAKDYALRRQVMETEERTDVKQRINL